MAEILKAALIFTKVPVIIILSGGMAHAYLGEVVASFPAPSRSVTALAANGRYLFVLCTWIRERVYITDPDTGYVYKYYPAPFNDHNRGLGYEYGGYLWVGYEGVKPVYYARVARCDASTGSILSSFTIYEHDIAVGGLDCQGDPRRPGTLTAILSSDNWSFYGVTRHKPTGRFIDSFRYGPNLHLKDLAWDYENELIWSPYGQEFKYVYGFTTAGSLVASFPVPPEPYAQWVGAAYCDEYLWLSHLASAPYYIYKVHCPKGFQVVEPASMGKIKALFR